MHDPIGSFLRIRELYITYLNTAFRIGDRAVSAERRYLLKQAENLCPDPILEPIPRYKPAGFGVEALVNDEADDLRLPGFSPTERRAFAEWALAGLFDSERAPAGGGTSRISKRPIYFHQAEMLRRGVQSGMPGIVTSGTGSGKTEAFLLPIFAKLSQEALKWDRPQKGYLKSFWWRDDNGRPWGTYEELPRLPSKREPQISPFISHRQGETRPAAVRALILYPMNALVEDQLVRLRRAVDSDLARATMDNLFQGNRIFLGRYTSATPVTGFGIHPRNADTVSRRRHKIEQLFDSISELWYIHREASANENARYLFPSVDGCELSNRWDMQESPPDILVTNVSMLSAMLYREVENGIFDKTRKWLQESSDSYFYIVLDELHLQRGSAGTEVSYLLKLLLDRLGLGDAAHRHKLRVLASSASLPVEGSSKDRDRSLSYLWDMFGSAGLARSRSQMKAKPGDWTECVIPGETVRETAATHRLDPRPFAAFLEKLETDTRDVVGVPDPKSFGEQWSKIFAALFPGIDEPDLQEVVRCVIEETARRLTDACWRIDERRHRATSVTSIAFRLFGQPSEDAVRAIRLMTILRGAAENFERWFKNDRPIEADSFRLHLFFRSLEGLFAPAKPNFAVEERFRSSERLVGKLSIERGQTQVPDGKEQARSVELLYCECCGELMFGGMAGSGVSANELELLPSDPDLEGLPEAARSQLFEDLSAAEYALFWPREREDTTLKSSGWGGDEWQRAVLDPSTGRILTNSLGLDIWVAHPTLVRGYLYRRADDTDRHGRKLDSKGTAVPYSCPACQTDYSPRKKLGGRLSPIRNFRAGFGKTTQLLASELFSALDAGNAERNTTKLVAFSDSRQDAARAALDIERRHHEDMWRQILVEVLRAAQSGADPARIKAEIEALKADANEALSQGKFEVVEQKTKLASQLQKQLSVVGRKEVPITSVLESLDNTDYLGPRSGRSQLRPLLRRLVAQGVHPTNDDGVTPIRIQVDPTGSQSYQWHELFEMNGESIDWRDNPLDQVNLNKARMALVERAHKRLSETLFSKTYFSLEETGLGYPALENTAKLPDVEMARLNAFLRVFTDSYRYLYNRWDNEPTPWDDARAISKRTGVYRFASALEQGNVNELLDRTISELGALGHLQGMIENSRLSVVLVENGDPYWRCTRCGRTHLHRGADICTRCFHPLPASASGTASELRADNFLAKRVERKDEVYRLHCEELTGQTEHPAERQRKFKNVLLDSDFPGVERSRLPILRTKEIIDLLAVTTTMEVGIDIGPLLGTFQANMPPQRFNYQQRVGRAGRRGQPFSLVLTVCRSKSHDLHYFRHPERITGDNPPPPFLNKKEPAIPQRFVRKAWVAYVFEKLRKECQATGETYPGDEIVPPDIHGEFIPYSSYLDATSGWRQRLLDNLEGSTQVRDRIAESLLRDRSELETARVLAPLEPNQVIRELDELQELLRGEQKVGLAHCMAEAGLLPMYGMPTRVRELYVEDKKDPEDDKQFTWRSIDRDADLAIYEFAPGQVNVRDKFLHKCIGFTGALPNFRKGNKSHPRLLTPYGEPFEARFWLLQCPSCGTWSRHPEAPQTLVCTSCREAIDNGEAHECRAPSAYRTDLHPSPIEEDAPIMRRHRTITAEGVEVKLQAVPKTNLSVYFRDRVRTCRVNGGEQERLADGRVTGRGFLMVQGEEQRFGLTIENQSISDDLRPRGFQLEAGAQPNSFWLASAKATDALFLAPLKLQEGLRPQAVGQGSNRAVSVRAAALSATFILVYRAALELDADPEEFDIVEPRFFRPNGASPVPLLQVTDHLVNGSGYCRRLAEPDAAGVPQIAEFLHSVVEDPDAYPMRDFLDAASEHARKCQSSCYFCLQRYGNQPYHGLLDWRLGLAFLKVLDQARWRCGLDGNFKHQSIADWPDMAEDHARKLLSMAVAGKGRIRRCGPVTAFRLEPSFSWTIVFHPLWDPHFNGGVVGDCLLELGDGKSLERFETVDTFELVRRPLQVRQRLLQKGRDRAR
jgi:DEAD/DEAH box helicase domain-containing protein